MAIIRSPEVLKNLLTWWLKFVLAVMLFEIIQFNEAVDLGKYFYNIFGFIFSKGKVLFYKNLSVFRNFSKVEIIKNLRKIFYADASTSFFK